jgi:hypothetical protein
VRSVIECLASHLNMVIIIFMCSELVATTALTPVAGGLLQVVDGAWAAYVAEKIPRSNPTTRANIVNDYMHSLVSTHLPDIVPTKAPRGDKPFYLLGELTLRLKFLHSSRPSNVATGAQHAVAEQQTFDGMELAEPDVQLTLDGIDAAEKPKPPYISIGYELDAAGAAISNVLAVLWEGNKLRWRIDLRNLAIGTATAPAIPIVPAAPTAPGLPLIAAKTRPASAPGSIPSTPAVASQAAVVVAEKPTGLAESG